MYCGQEQLWSGARSNHLGLNVFLSSSRPLSRSNQVMVGVELPPRDWKSRPGKTGKTDSLIARKVWIVRGCIKLRKSYVEGSTNSDFFAHPVKTRVIAWPTCCQRIHDTNLAITITIHNSRLAQQHLQQHHLYYNHDALYNDALYFGLDAFHRSASQWLGIGGLVSSSGQLVGKDSPTHFTSNSSLVRQHRANEQHGWAYQYGSLYPIWFGKCHWHERLPKWNAQSCLRTKHESIDAVTIIAIQKQNP